MNNNLVVGVDIGGTHITAALVDIEKHAIVDETLVRCPVNSKGDTEQVISEWCMTVRKCRSLSNNSSHKVGIAMPGPFDYDKGISFIKGLDKYESLYNLNVKELLAAALEIGTGDICMMNDASCFLKGEVFGGAAIGKDNVIGITLGTGLGSAVWKQGIIDGDLYYAPYKDATAEDYLSARWFIRRYRELTGEVADNVKEISNKVHTDSDAVRVFKEFGANLGEILSYYIKRHNAEVVVVGGNIIKSWHLFIEETGRVLSDHSLNVLLLKAKLGEDAAILGAGSLCAR